MARKVQSAKNVLEGNKHVANVQQMLMSASYLLLKLWSKIISQEEDFEFEAEELLKGYSAKLMCYRILFSEFKYPWKKAFQRLPGQSVFIFGRFRF